jgi:hypothetical protein
LASGFGLRETEEGFESTVVSAEIPHFCFIVGTINDQLLSRYPRRDRIFTMERWDKVSSSSMEG